jgi:DNA repair protein RadC
MLVKIPKVKEFKIVNNPENVSAIFSAILNSESEYDREKEHFWMLALNIKNNVKIVELISMGSLFTTIVHPREVYRPAIMTAGVASIIVAHNHPSGDPIPSDEDIKITKQLIEAGDILGIKLLDHVIVTLDSAKYLSMKFGGYI